MRQDKKEVSVRDQHTKSGSPVIMVLMAGAAAAMGFISVCLFSQTISRGAEAAAAVFSTARDEEREQVYNDYYEKYRDEAEKKYHVSNRAVITVDGVNEIAELEVLNVNAVGYSVEDKKDNKTAVSWIKVSGTGVFTVNLKASEFLVDNERRYVLVRVPEPELTRFTTGQAETLLYDDRALKILGTTLLDGSTRQGADLAQRQAADASRDARESIRSNQRFYESAKKSAQILIENLVKELNCDVPELVVEVEFVNLK